VLGNHLHLVLEADSDEALSQAMQGLCIRIARALNAMMGRAGAVFSDHYHSRLLRAPQQLIQCHCLRAAERCAPLWRGRRRPLLVRGRAETAGFPDRMAAALGLASCETNS
jgi:hypothetical protein